jgi:hypothetical protein
MREDWRMISQWLASDQLTFKKKRRREAVSSTVLEL